MRPKKTAGARTNGVSMLTGTTKSRICSSVMAYPNGTKFTVELTSMKGRPRFIARSLKPFLRYESAKFCKNFLFFFCHFAHFAKIAITHACVLRSCWNFGTRIGGLKANTSIDFWVNLINTRINIEGVISNFTHNSKSNFCQAYRVNRFEEQAENR